MEATKALTVMEGTVDSVIFRNEENGYTVLRLEVGDGDGGGLYARRRPR